MIPNTIAKCIDTLANDRNPNVVSVIFRHRADPNVCEFLWHHNFSEMPFFPLEQGPMKLVRISVKAIQPYDAVRIPICQQNVSWRVSKRGTLWDTHRLTVSWRGKHFSVGTGNEREIVCSGLKCEP